MNLLVYLNYRWNVFSDNAQPFSSLECYNFGKRYNIILHHFHIIKDLFSKVTEDENNPPVPVNVEHFHTNLSTILQDWQYGLMFSMLQQSDTNLFIFPKGSK